MKDLLHTEDLLYMQELMDNYESSLYANGPLYMKDLVASYLKASYQLAVGR